MYSAQLPLRMRSAPVEAARSLRLCKKEDIQIGCPLAIWSGQRGSNSLPASRKRLRHLQEPCRTSLFTRSAPVEAARSLRLCKKEDIQIGCPLAIWSGQRGSNSLPPPWQGGALPDELCPRNKGYSTRETPACQDSSARFSEFSSAAAAASPPITNSISPTGPCAG